MTDLIFPLIDDLFLPPYLIHGLTPSPEEEMADARAVKDLPNDKINYFINALRLLVKSGYGGSYRNTKPREF